MLTDRFIRIKIILCVCKMNSYISVNFEIQTRTTIRFKCKNRMDLNSRVDQRNFEKEGLFQFAFHMSRFSLSMSKLVRFAVYCHSRLWSNSK